MSRRRIRLIENGLASVLAAALLIGPSTDANGYNETSQQSGIQPFAATSAAEVHEHQEYPSVQVTKDQPWILPGGVLEIHLNNLTMEPGARIIVTPESSSVRLVVHGNSHFAEGTRIEIRGANGSSPGARGSEAANFEADLGVAQILGLEVISRGGDGAQGARGSRGASAIRKSCTGGSGRPAYSGERGGRGGDAGNGGDIAIKYTAGSDFVEIQARSLPGNPGAGGAGGPGGRGASSVRCLGYRRGGYAAGRTGPTGPSGDIGREGNVNIQSLSRS